MAESTETPTLPESPLLTPTIAQVAPQAGANGKGAYSAAENAPKRDDDLALLAAWEGLLDYDFVSTDQKKSYRFIRKWAIWMTLGATIAATAAAVLMSYQANSILEVMRIALVIMPIVSVALMNYASEYARNTAWIEYRVGAEMLRSQIYLYRTGAGDYANKSKVEKQALLVASVKKAYQRISSSDFVPYMRAREKMAIKEDIKLNCRESPGTSNEDPGLGALSVENYLEWRIKPQIKWYVGRIEQDYLRKRHTSIQVLILAGMGSALVGLYPPFAPIVAITTGAGVALTLWSNVQTTGATYGIFHKAASDLQLCLREWEILPPEFQAQPKHQNKLVMDMEFIFEQERNEWEKQVRMMQQSVEQAFKDSRNLRNEEKDNDENSEEEEDTAEGEVAK
ncbi:MAG: DUF4231 domain-containing protein [Chitinophagaceae bacterium]|nr:DUF4231 domain-containing protein [Anaerolineae bacterium]